MVAIKAHFDGKVFIPDEPVDFPRGQSVVITPTATDIPPTDKPFLEWVAETLVARTDLPSDSSLQHDHYLYGTPKRPTTE